MEKEKLKQENEKVYLVGFIAMTIKGMLDSSSLIDLGKLDLLLIGTFFLCIFWKLIKQTYTLKSALITIALLGMCAYSCIRMSYYTLFYSAITVVAMKDVDIKKIMRSNYVVKATILAFHVMVYIIRFVVAPGSITYSYRTDGVPRHFFLMGHANTFSAYLVWTILAYMYVNYEKLTTIRLIILWSINFIFYLFTDSNTSVLIMTLTVVLIVFDKQKNTFVQNMVRKGAKNGFMICSIFFAAIASCYRYFNGSLKEVYTFIDNMFSNRIMYGSYAFDMYGATLFGRQLDFPPKVHWDGHWIDGIIFDNMYLWMFIKYGSIYLIIISSLLLIIAKRLSSIECLILCIWMFYGITEAYVIDIFMCFPFFIIGNAVYQIIQEHRDKKFEIYV